MSKMINKSEREYILRNLVADACKGTASKAIKALATLRSELHSVLLENWQSKVPGVSRIDQMTLLQEHCVHTLNLSNLRVNQPPSTVRGSGEFGKLWWTNEGVSETEKQRRSNLASLIFQRVSGASNTMIDGTSTGWSSELRLLRSFPDLIAGFMPSAVFAPGVEAPKDLDKALNEKLYSLHTRVIAELQKLRDLLDSAEAMYHDLGAAIAPVKKADELAELMPEAVKHFPPSLTFVKPTKELADPKAINDIRAKLKAGLPV